MLGEKHKNVFVTLDNHSCEASLSDTKRETAFTTILMKEVLNGSEIQQTQNISFPSWTATTT